MKPMGTIQCPVCGQLACGKLDLVCDNCKHPYWSVFELKQAFIDAQKFYQKTTGDESPGFANIYQGD